MKFLEIENNLIELIIEARTLGMSVIEIRKITCGLYASQIHYILQKSGLITQMHSSDENRKHIHILTSIIRTAFKKEDISFKRWCVGWGFNPFEAAVTISSSLELNEYTPNSSTHYEAFRRDFPWTHYRIFKGEKPGSCSLSTPSKHHTITYEPSTKLYTAVATYILDISVSDKDCAEVSRKFNFLYSRYASIQRLNEFISLQKTTNI